MQRQILELRQHRTRMDHWEDTLRSRWWKRLWWFALGFRLCTLGRWYRAPWNESAVKYGD